MELIDIMDQRDLTNIYSTLHPNTNEYTFFSGPHKTFPKISYMLGHKASLNRYKNIEIISCILPDHHGLKPDFNNSINTRNPTNSFELNSSVLNNSWVKEEIKGEIKKFVEYNENEGTTYPNL